MEPTAILVALIAAVFGPISVLYFTRRMDQQNKERAAELKTAVDRNLLNNTLDHGEVVAAIESFQAQLADYREDVVEYRKNHAREHELLRQLVSKF